MVEQLHRMVGKCAVVTGAGSGIGSATARRLSDEGAELALLDIDGAATEKVAAELGATAIAVDVSSSRHVDSAFAEAVARLGRIDVLAHIAGVDGHRDVKQAVADHRAARAAGNADGGFDGITELTDDEWRRVLSVNLDGTFFVLRAALRHMVQNRTGAIVTTASTAALSGVMGLSHYCAAKAGIKVLTQSAAHEAIGYGIRVNTVAPGATDTPLLARTPKAILDGLGGMPIGRPAQPEEIAAVIAYLLSDDASYLVGETVNANGGMIMV